MLLFPEIPFDEAQFLGQGRRSDQALRLLLRRRVGRAAGRRTASSCPTPGLRDAFGHAQLGGVAPLLANLVKDKLKLKYHWAVADYLQRAARHIASKTDVAQAYAVGKAAVELALKGKNAVMPDHRAQVRQAVQMDHRRGRTSKTSPTSRRSCRATTSPTTATTSPPSAAPTSRR